MAANQPRALHPMMLHRILAGLILAPFSLNLAAAEPPTAWAPGLMEVAVRLSAPADPAAIAAIVGRTIPYQDADPSQGPAEILGRLKIAGASTTEGGRLLHLFTDPHPRPAFYSLPLEGVSPAAVALTLAGVEASWFEGDDLGAEPRWKGWASRPSLQAIIDRAENLAAVGRLRFDAQVKTPAGKGTVTVASPSEIVEAFVGDAEPEGGVRRGDDGRWLASFPVEAADLPLFFSLTVKTGLDVPSAPCEVRWESPGAAGLALDASRFLLPWAVASLAAEKPEPLDVPDLSGGDPARGEAAFFSKEALCSQCHVVAGKGGAVGPDLTTIGRKGAEHLYRSLAVPGESITPDFVTYTVSLKDGRIASGVVRAEGPDAIRVIDVEARPTLVRRDEIEDFRPASASLMPPGLIPVLGEARLRDIVAYLMKTAGK